VVAAALDTTAAVAVVVVMSMVTVEVVVPASLTRLVSLLVLPQQETIDFLQMVPILIEESLVKAVSKISLALMVNLSSPNK
jgi:hypothetical protein